MYERWEDESIKVSEGQQVNKKLLFHIILPCRIETEVLIRT